MESFEQRLKSLEERVASLERQYTVKSTSPSNEVRAAPGVQAYQRPNPYAVWLKENGLALAGVFLIFIAAGWFVHYAFSNNWLGETMRIMLGCSLGSFAYVLGLFFLKRKVGIAEHILVLGQGVFLLSLFAAYHLYDLFSMTSTLIAMLSTIAVTTFTSVYLKIKSLGYSSLIFSILTPFAVYSATPNPIFLLWYSALINIVGLYMLLLRGWKQSLYIAWVSTLIYAANFSIVGSIFIQLSFIWVFFLTFLIPTTFAVYKKNLSVLPHEGIVSLVVLPWTFMYWNFYYVPLPLQIVSLAAASCFWIALGYLFANNWESFTTKRLGVKWFYGRAIGFVAVFQLLWAISSWSSFKFSISDWGYVASIVDFIVIALAIAVGRFIFKSHRVALDLSLFLFYEAALLFRDFQTILKAPLLTLPFATMPVAILTLFCVVYIHSFPLLDSSVHEKRASFRALLCVLLGAFGMALIWNVYYNLFSMESLSRGCALITYVVIAEVLIYTSYVKQQALLRVGGISIICLVIARLLLTEVWIMPAVVRTVTFVIIGLLLLGTSYFDKKLKSS